MQTRAFGLLMGNVSVDILERTASQAKQSKGARQFQVVHQGAYVPTLTGWHSGYVVQML
jgi:hypothetical protein